MKFGFSLSNNQGIEDVQSIIRLATRAEALGFDSVWASDHVFNVSYVYERIGDGPYYDPLTILSYIAAVTTRFGVPRAWATVGIPRPWRRRFCVSACATWQSRPRPPGGRRRRSRCP
jgi:alkanesulfonate monooxygenase SsuD/methylene tetrahydromethanopterin reductase-like flavin-dependent oxidoreductase (luciferase family)